MTLPPAGPVTVARIRIEGEAPQTSGGAAEAKLEFVGSCPGTEPSVPNNVIWQGRTLTARLESCTLTIVASEPVFRRGDANGDGTVDISDPLSILGCNFLGFLGNCPTCEDAADSDDTGGQVTAAYADIRFRGPIGMRPSAADVVLASPAPKRP